MTTPIWTRLPGEIPDEILKRLEDLKQREGSVWQDQLRSHGIVRNPLNPNQIAVPAPVLGRGPPPRIDGAEKNLDKALERLEERRRREAELFERLDQLKARRLALPRLVELPAPFPLPPPRLVTERRRMIPT
jgi:hypothetical protein